MNPSNHPLLASVALEPNRWKPVEARVPSFKVSDWSAPAAAAGFGGWELWEPHYFLADDAERARLHESAFPVRIFNTYALPGIDPDSRWQQVVDAVRRLGPQVRGIKFNLGKDPATAAAQIEAAMEWAAQLPEQVRLLCECHPGTVLETPDGAGRAFATWPASRFGAILHPLGGGPDHCDAWFSALPGRIEHLHWQGRDADNRICSITDDSARLTAVLDALRRHAFTGTQSIEFVCGTGRPGESVDGLFAAAKADLPALGDGSP